MSKRKGWKKAKEYMDNLVPTGSRLFTESDNAPFMRMYESEDGETTIVVTGKASCIMPVKVVNGEPLFGFIDQYREEEGAPVFRTTGKYALDFDVCEIISHGQTAVETCFEKGGITISDKDIYWLGMHIGFATVISPIKLGIVVVPADTQSDTLKWLTMSQVREEYTKIAENGGKSRQGSSDALQTIIFLQWKLDTGELKLSDLVR